MAKTSAAPSSNRPTLTPWHCYWNHLESIGPAQGLASKNAHPQRLHFWGQLALGRVPKQSIGKVHMMSDAAPGVTGIESDMAAVCPQTIVRWYAGSGCGRVGYGDYAPYADYAGRAGCAGCADYAAYAVYADYAGYADCADYAVYAGYAGYAEYAGYADYGVNSVKGVNGVTV